VIYVQGLIAVICVLLFTQIVFSQTLPRSLRQYLDRNYHGWKVAGECYEKESENKRVLVGDFDGNGKRDYAVKFIRGEKGFLIAFLADGRRWKPFYLHIWKDAEDARKSDLMLFKKGERYHESYPWKLRFDAPADFWCESDVGGLHVYRQGKFIAY
jgi:hypothetical protein